MTSVLKIGLDRQDPRRCVMVRNEEVVLRFGSSKQTRDAAEKLLSMAKQQERHEQGASLVLPPDLEVKHP